MDAHHLEFDDNTFDTVVATFVFCSVPAAIQGLREARRVLKPSGLEVPLNSHGTLNGENPMAGKLLLLEHVRVTIGFTGKVMDTLHPLVVRLGGFHINHRTVQDVIWVGFHGVQIYNLKDKLIKSIKASK